MGMLCVFKDVRMHVNVCVHVDARGQKGTERLLLYLCMGMDLFKCA